MACCQVLAALIFTCPVGTTPPVSTAAARYHNRNGTGWRPSTWQRAGRGTPTRMRGSSGQPLTGRGKGGDGLKPVAPAGPGDVFNKLHGAVRQLAGKARVQRQAGKAQARVFANGAVQRG